VLGVGGIGMLGDRPRRQRLDEGGIIGDIGGCEPGRGARAEFMDHCSDHDVRQRHAFGGTDHGRNEAHRNAPSTWRQWEKGAGA
jgi:hypothetical protein